jgi:tRNA-splicing ligase RtcB (3'-phosphate/5'-hydroxy nucleic acid ligase)
LKELKENAMPETTYNVIAPETGVPVKTWTKGVPLEDAARKQLLNAAQLPFIFKWIAAMPDVHWGIGATVGSVIPTKGAIIPAAVGVDIGCGMMAVQTSLNSRDLPDNLKGIRSAIETAVPHGRTNQGGTGDRGAWHDIPARTQEVWLPGSRPGRRRRSCFELMDRSARAGDNSSAPR